MLTVECRSNCESSLSVWLECILITSLLIGPSPTFHVFFIKLASFQFVFVRLLSSTTKKVEIALSTDTSPD